MHQPLDARDDLTKAPNCCTETTFPEMMSPSRSCCAGVVPGVGQRALSEREIRSFWPPRSSAPDLHLHFLARLDQILGMRHAA